MNKRVLIFLLAFIIGVFTYAGYRNVVISDSEITKELHHTYDLAHELSIAYVWYDISIGDIIARYSAGSIDKSEMIKQIELGKAKCHEHLVAYAKESKSYESLQMGILYTQDSSIDEAITKIINDVDNPESIDCKVTALYNTTRKILETINYIITTRSRYIECLDTNIQKDNMHIRDYLINSFTMSLVLFMASFMKLKNLETPNTTPSSHHPHKHTKEIPV